MRGSRIYYFNKKILICSLLTLAPHNPIFKDLDLNKINEDYFIISLLEQKTLSQLLNQTCVRLIAYTIIQPLLCEDLNKEFKRSTRKIVFEESLMIRQYLRKFNYYYKSFFYNKVHLNNCEITNKEINLRAIKILFFIIGI